MPADRRAQTYRLAVMLEEESVRFYEELLAAIPERAIQSEVRFLRDEEKKHEAFFEGLLQRAGGAGVRATGGAPADADVQKLEQELLLPMRQQRDAKALANRAEALRLGARFERGAIDFYQALRQAEPDAEAAGGLDEVIEEEKRHLRKLNVILAY